MAFSWVRQSRLALKKSNVRILMKQEMTRWQWHQMDYVQIIYTSLWTKTTQASHCSFVYRLDVLFLMPTNSVKALKAMLISWFISNRFKISECGHAQRNCIHSYWHNVNLKSTSYGPVLCAASHALCCRQRWTLSVINCMAKLVGLTLTIIRDNKTWVMETV